MRETKRFLATFRFRVGLLNNLLIPGGRLELPSFTYEINILPLNYPGKFIPKYS